jgi:hypothetical protein
VGELVNEEYLAGVRDAIDLINENEGMGLSSDGVINALAIKKLIAIIEGEA